MDALQKYREQIDAIDTQLLDLFGQRFAIIRAVGRLKAENNIDVVQSARAVQVVERAMRMAAERGVDPDYIRGVYESMIDLAHIIEQEITEQHEKS